MLNRTARPAAALCATLLSVTGCSSGFGKSPSGDSPQDNAAKQHLTVLIASSGDAETAAVKAAAAAYSKKSGNTVTVDLAKDLNQQLGQAFAGNRPPDVFYVGPDQFANYAKGGSLYAYGDTVGDVSDFSAQLRQSFTYNGKLTCLPKDTSTLGLAINTTLWQQAGLTEADYPTTWEQLEKSAQKLTSGQVTGLVSSNEYQRLGAFMQQAGGWITDKGQNRMTADTPANEQALTFVKTMLQSGSMKFPAQVDAGWGGEAFGKGKAAMTIEGNWLQGAMKKDFPDVKYKILQLPAGPAGKGSLAFSNCWGIASASSHRDAAVDLVKYLTSVEQQLAFGEAFGVMPSRTSALKVHAEKHAQDTAWVEAAAYAQGPITLPGFDKVLTQFNTELQSLRTTDAKSILSSLQRNGEQALGKAG